MKKSLSILLALLVAAAATTPLAALSLVSADSSDGEEREAEAELEDPGNFGPPPSGVTGEIEFVDDGSTTLTITGEAEGLTPGVPYVSLIYDIFSLAVGDFACEPSFAPDDPSAFNIFATMFVGEWDVDEDGDGTLSAINIGPTFAPGPPVYVPLSKIGTISIRDGTVEGDFGPGTGPAAVVACGVVEVDELVGTFDWLFGDDLDSLLAPLGIPAFGPAVAVDEDGNRIEISGSGTFTLGGDDDDEDSVTGGGTYKIFDASGSLIAEGTWTITEFDDFEDFGRDPGSPPEWRGGILEAEIELEGLGEGEIVIICDLVQLDLDAVTVETDDMDFEEALPPAPGPAGGGLTLFLDT